MAATAAPLQIDWTNTLFLAVAHGMALLAVFYILLGHCSWWTAGLAGLWYVLCGLSITGGYHRLFAHPTYKAGKLLRLFYVCFGAGAVQNSAWKWSADHRLHHSDTDGERDVYNITRGFLWAHIGWVLFKDPGNADPNKLRDLAADPIVRFQDRYYVPLALLFGLVLPTGLGFLWGDPLGALLVACFLRLVVQYHSTFSVNSFAHMIGRRPFSKGISARDSFWVAILTFGEGYHNFHHRFQSDYRNGYRWYHFDPTKWFVWTAARVGLASDLRTVSETAIQRARTTAG